MKHYIQFFFSSHCFGCRRAPAATRQSGKCRPPLRLPEHQFPMVTAIEVAQDTWLAVLTGPPAFEGRGSLKSWMFGIVANKAKSRGARERRMIPFADLMIRDDEGAVDADRFMANGSWKTPPARWSAHTSEADFLRREALSIVERVLGELPAAQRGCCCIAAVRKSGRRSNTAPRADDADMSGNDGTRAAGDAAGDSAAAAVMEEDAIALRL